MAFQGGKGGRRVPAGGNSGGSGFGGGGRGGGPSVPREPPFSPGPAPPPNTLAHKLEDALQASNKNALSLASVKLNDQFPARPGYGTRGKVITLWANYVEILVAPQLTLYRYAITMKPDDAGGKKRTQIVRLLLETSKLAPMHEDIVTDFKSTLFSRTKIPRDEVVIPPGGKVVIPPSDDVVIPVTYRFEGEDEPLAQATTYEVTLKFTNTLSVRELAEYLTSTDWSAAYDSKLDMIQAFNIFLNHYSKSAGNLATIGSSKTFSLETDAKTFHLGKSLTAVRGFFASVRVAANRVLVNVNVSHGAFYDARALDQLIAKCGRKKRKLNSFLWKLRVRTTHLKGKKNKKSEEIPRIKTVLGLATLEDGRTGKPPPEHPPIVPEYGAGAKAVKFWLEASASGQRNSGPPQASLSSSKKKGPKSSKQPVAGPPTAGGYISVYDFFLRTYGRRIADPDLPVVNVHTRENPIYLPTEVCMVCEGQNASALEPSQTEQMIQFAVRRPMENMGSIVKDGIRTVGLSTQTNPILNKFHVSVNPRLITVPGRQLDAPKVTYRGKPAQTRNGTWNMEKIQFNKCGVMPKWSYVLISLPSLPEYKDAFTNSSSLVEVVKKFVQVLRNVGMQTTEPIAGRRWVLESQDDPVLDKNLEVAAQALDLLLIILPERLVPIYNRIKQLGDVKFGIHTICTVGHKLKKEKGQDHMSNVALKFNLKLGGNNQSVDRSRLGLIAEDKTMLVGIDVTHPSPGSLKTAPSVAAMVASVDSQLGQWPATLSIQTARQELVDSLKGMLKSHLRLWKTKGKHTALPENIIIYRDGVSEGQYQIVLDKELPLLRGACKETYPPADTAKGLPRLTVIIVGKRHHTRFYPTQEKESDGRSGNTLPGTVVDRGVTEPRIWDFFLQAHAAIQGTARPAHYVVVLDEAMSARYSGRGRANQLPQGCRNAADALEDMTQSLCYVFGRATKAVSICTPAYYADIACERARCYLSGLFDASSVNASPDPSVAGSATGAQPVVGASEEGVEIQRRLRETMFYI
ncbi:Uu.00g047440.m01.CDS01 [Anthostomella pinea]|uniref:Uu.00g047440.m01.CDS01 n=1 Tax=Anthostomella pinea TaxID=933095 RepID=A0AAI8VBJ8_9PEZI|nr:Uu.00g047440.m01.CDS01 [Anthostomella pinea]